MIWLERFDQALKVKWLKSRLKNDVFWPWISSKYGIQKIPKYESEYVDEMSKSLDTPFF